MTHLPLILSHPPETPLREVIHTLDRYGLRQEMEDAGYPVEWDTVLAWETCGDVADAVAAFERKAA